MRKILSVVAAFCFISGAALAQIQSPVEFLGYESGEQWTPHYKVLNYFQHVAQESPMVSITEYGKSYEGRELVYTVVTSEENHQNLEEIRTNNLKLTGLESGSPSENKKAIVWLSYNVHGNETSSSEAALKTIYSLVTEKSDWLENVVVVMDPMLNPDGRDRYVNWYRTVVGEKFDPSHNAREHNEPWPGGRTNHYYFDLNRDWAWQTQIETKQRVEIYNQWMPQVHVDFHEQSYRSPYYFAPAAEPLHRAITDWQREFQVTIGKNHAKYFDKENWLYFTGERFDLFYPSYGDTWPIFNGAIGMTYEQAGGGFAGLGILTPEGDTLSLKDRLTHHYITGLSTVEITAQNHERVVDEFANYFRTSRENPGGKFETFVVKKSSNPDKVSMLLRYLLDQDIEFGAARSSGNANGYNFTTGESGRVSIEQGDYIISTAQPKGVLVRTLFEPSPELVDSLTYDITAWESHYAYGLEGYAVTGNIDTEFIQSDSEPFLTPRISKPYAYLAKWNSLDDLKYLSELLNRDVNVRYAEEEFSMNGDEYEPGTLIITRNSNEKLGNQFDEIVKDVAAEFNRIITPVATGFVDTGKDFGSSSVRFIEKPSVAMLSGSGTRSNEVGYIWHYFDQQINYPLSLINIEDAGSADWQNYQVLIMPSGSYGSLNEGFSKIQEWVRNGGTLIAVGGANNYLTGKTEFSLQRRVNEDSVDDDPESKLKKYSEASRERVQSANAGSVYSISMDETHPLAFGYGEQYMSLKLGTSAFEYLDNGWNVGAAKADAHRSGFVGNKAKRQLENTLTFGVQDMGRGKVVYMIDNPLFRGFWHNGKLLFGNAVFFVGNS
ncbi:MAG: M14 family metallopeptidase [Balneolaceae bacterium]